MKRAYLTRYGAYGDHVHMSNVIKALDEEGWDVTFEYNYKGAQIHSYNPRIDKHVYFEPYAKPNQEPVAIDAHNALHKKIAREYDLYVNFGDSLENALIEPEHAPAYFWPLWMRRAKNTSICYYDQSMKWAGLTDSKYMGRTGEIYFPDEENKQVLKQLEPYKDKFIVLWAFRGTMQQKAVYPMAQEIVDHWLEAYPDSVVITTGDPECKKFEWETPHGKTIKDGMGDGTASLVHRSGRMPFRQALCMAQYVDLVVTPETGLGIGAGAFGTPKIMLLTAASLKNIVGNDKNDYSLQSEAYCSPCTRAIYNTRNCEMNGEHPICVNFDKDRVFTQMKRVYSAGRTRPDRPAMEGKTMSPIPHSAIDSGGLARLYLVALKAPPGDFVEVGVYHGGSAWHLNKICQDRDRVLHLFDTFTGIPFADEIDRAEVGWFNDVSFESVVENFPDAKIYKGVYPDTLPNDLDNVAFVHVDCDQYRSIKAVIETMVPRMVKGGIMYFDDYYNLPGAKKAIDESLTDVVAGGMQAGIWTKP